MTQHANLHPKEHSLVAGLELEDKDPASGAGGHRLELHIVREDDQVILELQFIFRSSQSGFS